jgi:Biotin synthase-related enzyme
MNGITSYKTEEAAKNLDFNCGCSENKENTDIIGSSPEYLKVSLAAAMTMDFVPGIFYRNACLHCINVLLTYEEGCRANCAYCGLQKSREGGYNDKSFIRVDWPAFKTDYIIESTLKKKK